MSEEQQLDRSVLEGKKADEVRAIAAAVGVPLTGRPTKAGMIDKILQSTGGNVSDQSTQVADRAPASERTDSAERSEVPERNEVSKRPDAAERPRRNRAPRARAESGAPTLDLSDSGSTTSGRPTAAPATTPPSDVGAPTPSGAATQAPDAPSVRNEGGRTDAPSTGGSSPRNDGVRPESNGTASPAASETGGSTNGAGKPPQSQQSSPQRNDRQGRGFDGYAADANTSRSSRRRRGRRDRQGGPNAPRETGGGGYERTVEQAEAQFQGEPVDVAGFLELRDEGFGFLRTKGFKPAPNDVYVPVSQVRKYALRKGDHIEGTSRPATSNEKYPALLSVTKVGGLDPDVARNRPRFEDLTPLFPDERLRLERPGDPANLTARIVDLLSPIGKGQRGLIVSPPKAGKTTVMKQIAHSIEANNPDVHLIVLLVDERPEEVTDMRRSVKGGEIIASTFDRPADEHTRVAEIAIERAKRLVEQGRDVVIILDGITRLARAYNLAAPASGRILSGGVDSGALYPPKKFFGSARNIEEGGSLTILATALVETGSKMDEVIFEEFKGTGNMELRLDRRLAERRLYPAIDANGSSTRHEELLFERSQLNQVWKLRRVLSALSQDGGNPAAGLELLMDKIKSTASNDEFLAEIAKNPAPGS